MAIELLRHTATVTRHKRIILLHLRRSSSSSSSAAAAAAELPTLQPSGDADLLSQMLLHHHNPFHAMESCLQLHGISLTPSLLHQTLLRLRHSSKIALSLFHYSLSLPSASTDVTTASYNLIIDILAKVRQFDVCWQLIIQMGQQDNNNEDEDCNFHCRPNFLTFSILIRRLIAAGFTRQAIRAFDDMQAFLPQGTAVDETHFCFLLDTLCKYGYVKVAVEIFNKRKFSFNPNVRMYTVLIYGWCKLGRFDMAERFLREMDERGIEPNVVTYNVWLNGICRRARLQPEFKFEKTIVLAEKVFDEMRQRGIEPDVTSFSIVLHVYSRAHKPELTMDKLKLMKEKGISPTVATYTSVIKCLTSSGRIDDAEKLLDEMVVNEVSPSAVTYNCFLKEYRGRNDVEGALKLYRKMRDQCMPSLQTYNILLGMFVKLNRMDIVNEIWGDLKGSGLGPDLDSYTLFIHELCEKEKWREACGFFVEMIEKGLLPQKVTFETLYKGLIQSDMLRTWRRLKKKLDQESITFGSEFQSYHLKPYRR